MLGPAIAVIVIYATVISIVSIPLMIFRETIDINKDRPKKVTVLESIFIVIETFQLMAIGIKRENTNDDSLISIINGMKLVILDVNFVAAIYAIGFVAISLSCCWSCCIACACVGGRKDDIDSDDSDCIHRTIIYSFGSCGYVSSALFTRFHLPLTHLIFTMYNCDSNDNNLSYSVSSSGDYEVKCWTPIHTTMATIGFIVLIMYTVALFLWKLTIRDELIEDHNDNHEESEIKYNAVYLCVKTIGGTVIVIVTVFMTDHVTNVISNLIVIVAILFIITLKCLISYLTCTESDDDRGTDILDAREGMISDDKYINLLWMTCYGIVCVTYCANLMSTKLNTAAIVSITLVMYVIVLSIAYLYARKEGYIGCTKRVVTNMI